MQLQVTVNDQSIFMILRIEEMLVFLMCGTKIDACLNLEG